MISDSRIKKALGLALAKAARASNKYNTIRDPVKRAEAEFIALAGPMVEYLFNSGSSSQDLQSVTTQGQVTSNSITVAGLTATSFVTTVGAVTGNSLLSAGDVHVNYNGPDTDSFLYFYNAGDLTNAYLGWDDSATSFVLSHRTGAPTFDATASGSTFKTLTVWNDITVGGTLDTRSNNIINVLDPVDDQDAATKKYVDDLTGGSVGTLQLVTDNGATTDNPLLVTSSGSIFTTLTATQDALVGGDFVVDGTVEVGGAAEVGGAFTSRNNIYVRYDIHVNYDGPDADSTIYFYDGGSPTGAYLRWDDSESLFQAWSGIRTGIFWGQGSGSKFKTLTSYGDMTVGGTLDTRFNNIINVLDPVNPQDAATKYYVDNTGFGTLQQVLDTGNTTTTLLKASVSGSTFSALGIYGESTVGENFRVGGNLKVVGTSIFPGVTFGATGIINAAQINTVVSWISGDTLRSLNEIYVNHNGPDSDGIIYFYDGSSPTGQFFLWDDSESEFGVTSRLRAPTFKTTASGSVFKTLTTYGKATIGGTLDTRSNNIINVLDPVNPQDAATKNYVDTAGIGTFQQVLDTGNTTTTAFTASVSGSSFSALTIYGEEVVGGNLRVGGNFRVVGTSIFPGITLGATGILNAAQINTTVSWISGQALRSLTSVYVNYDGTDEDSHIYFYENFSPIGAALTWDDSESEFLFSHRTGAPTFKATASGSTFSTLTAYSDVHVGGNAKIEGPLTAYEVRSQGDIFVKHGGSEGDSNIYFYDAGNPVGAYLRWDDSENLFQAWSGIRTGIFWGQGSGSKFSTLTSYGNTQIGGTLKVAGQITGSFLESLSNIQVNSGGPEGNGYIYFYDGGSDTGRVLFWDDAENQFAVSGAGGFRSAIFKATASGSTFSTLTAYSDVHVGGNAKIEGDLIINGNTSSPGGTITGSPLASTGDVFINSDGPDGNSNLYFYDGGSALGESLTWVDASDEFTLSSHLVAPTLETSASGSTFNTLTVWDDAQVAHTFTAGEVRSQGNIFVNSNGPDGNSFLYFYDGNSPTGGWLYYDESLGRFHFSKALSVVSDVFAYGNVFVNQDGPDGDSFLYFYNASSTTGTYLQWDDSDETFRTNKAIFMPVVGTVDNASPAFCIGASPLDDFLWNTQYIPHYSFGGVYWQEGSPGTLSRDNAYMSGYFGLKFFTQGALRMTVRTTGEVGIGVTATEPVLKLEVNGTIGSYSNMYLNYDGADGDSYLYFYDASSPTGASLKWADTSARFEFDKNLYVNGTFKTSTSGSTFSALGIYGEGVVGGNFRTGGDLKVWGTSNLANVNASTINAAQINTTVSWISGQALRSLTDIYVNQDGPGGDGIIFFYDGGSDTGQSFRWDDSESEFGATSRLRAPTFKATASGSTVSTLTAYSKLHAQNVTGYDITALNTLTVPTFKATASGSTVSTLTAYSKLHAQNIIGTDIIGTDITGTDITALSSLTCGGLLSRGDVYVNYDGPDSNSHLYFYEGGSLQGAYLQFTDASARFDFTHPLYVTGTITASSGFRQLWGTKVRIVDAAGNADYTTIQSAITAATAGDTILVLAGTYAETITLKNGVNIRGINRPDVILNVSGSNSIINGPTTTTCTVTISDLTIVQSNATYYAVSCLASNSPAYRHTITFRNCSISKTADSGASRAINMSGTVNLYNCYISNTAGRAIYMSSAAVSPNHSILYLKDCEVIGNEAGIYQNSANDVCTIEDSKITGTTSYAFRHTSTADLLARHSTFTGTASPAIQVGVSATQTDVIIKYCTLYQGGSGDLISLASGTATIVMILCDFNAGTKPAGLTIRDGATGVPGTGYGTNNINNTLA